MDFHIPMPIWHLFTYGCTFVFGWAVGAAMRSLNEATRN